jgi:hypothetical protein
MYHRKRTDSSSLFLMEIVLAILLFAMTAAICISIFANAHTVSRSSEELSAAASETENAASVLRSSSSERGFINSMKDLFPEASVNESTVTVWYDESFEECSREKASYRLTASLDDSDSSLLTADISFYKKGSGKAIYSQRDKHAV